MSGSLSDLVEPAFSFLAELGFRRGPCGSHEVQYESHYVILRITWAPRSGELDLAIGLRSQTGEATEMFSLTDMLRMKNVNVPERSTPFQIYDSSRLAPFLDRLAEDTRVHAQEALIGDRLFFRRLSVFRTAESQVYMRGIQLQRIRRAADDAWRSGRLDQVVELYGSIEGDLTQSEASKLAYARKHRVD